MIKKTLNVAVAVIYYKSLYLLGYRNAKQDQGDRYEFVGGKIEQSELAIQGLIREVDEELGLMVTVPQCKLMGEITHDYGDKIVCLHVYGVEANVEQYLWLAKQTVGSLNQPIKWVKKSALIAGEYPLPEANAQILRWLDKN